MREQNPKQPGLLRVTRNGKRFYSDEYKRELIERCLVPGVSVAAVAFAHGFNANLVRNWVRKYQAVRGLRRPTPRLVPVTVVADSVDGNAEPAGERCPVIRDVPAGSIEIAFGAARVKVMGRVDPAQLRLVLDLLGVRR